MKKKVSLKDIAERVGVSITLVSYVLNNRFKDRINKEVAQKIRDTAEKLNYRPNHIAKSLKTKKTYTLGLVVADIANPFFSSLARIIEDEAEKYNYTVIFGSSDESAELSKKLVNVFLDHQVDVRLVDRRRLQPAAAAGRARGSACRWSPAWRWHCRHWNACFRRSPRANRRSQRMVPPRPGT